MNDREFKSNVVKVLKELTKRELSRSGSKEATEKYEEILMLMDVIIGPIKTEAYEVKLTMSRAGTRSNSIDLESLFKPALRHDDAVEDGLPAEFSYAVVGENSISATISGSGLSIPAVSNETESYSLLIDISVEVGGLPAHKEVCLALQFE